MKLLLDQNLSRRIVGALGKDFPGSSHVALESLGDASDERVWVFARDKGFAIVSKDADFHHLSFRYGAPPKTIWLRIGNCRTDEATSALLDNVLLIRTFLLDASGALLIIRQTSPAIRS